MRLFLLIVAAMLSAAPLRAQDARASSADKRASSAEDDAGSNLPVSLDRIRAGLANAPAKPLLSVLERPPDFTVEIEERLSVEEILSKTSTSRPGLFPRADCTRTSSNVSSSTRSTIHCGNPMPRSAAPS